MIDEQITTRAAQILQGKGWCQDCAAKNKQSERVGYDSPDAESFCILGALHRAAWELDLLKEFQQKLTGSAVLAWFNDQPGRTLQEVLRKLEEITDDHP